MNLAALALTVVFIADDARLPVLSMELVERSGARSFVAAMMPTTTAPPEGIERRDGVGREVLSPGAWPIGPAGTSVVPAVDGVIVTIDDAGTWAGAFALPAPDETKQTKVARPASSLHAWPPPGLPVAGPRSLRMFLPAVVDGAAMSASLHLPGGAAVPGVAVAWTRIVDVEGVVVARSHDEGIAGVEVVAPRFVPTLPAATMTPCSTDAVPVQLRLSSGMAGPGFCVGVLEIRGFRGLRHGDQPAKDRPAHGAILRRTTALPAAPASPASGGPPKPSPSRY